LYAQFLLLWFGWWMRLAELPGRVPVLPRRLSRFAVSTNGAGAEDAMSLTLIELIGA
jgi:hypothetical protein